MLSDSDIEALEDILFAEPWGDEALDFFGLAGGCLRPGGRPDTLEH